MTNLSYYPEKITKEYDEPTIVNEKSTIERVSEILDAMKDLLKYKNAKYGDSALNPNNIFYKGSATNSILIRLDDKIGRIRNRKTEEVSVNDVADIYMAKISFGWVLFSAIILLFIGWGTAENGLILYSLYFYCTRIFAEIRCVEPSTVKIQMKGLNKKFGCSRSKEIVQIIRDLGIEHLF